MAKNSTKSPRSTNGDINRETLAQIVAETGFPVLLTDEHGEPIIGLSTDYHCSCSGPTPARRIESAKQTLVWGEPIINLCCNEGRVFWAVPLTHNSKITGALVVEGIELEEEGANSNLTTLIRQSAEKLLAMAIQRNWINADTLRLGKRRAEWEQQRFVALESAKDRFARDDLRILYLREEPSLLVAIKEGEPSHARAVLNRILTGIYAVAGERLDLLKSCIIELVVMMSRAAVEAGADPTLLFGNNYQKFAELAEIQSDEDLAAWVRATLDNLIEVIRRNEHYPQSFLLQRALNHMHEHLDQPIRRDDVARVAGISPGHFSKLITERLGKSFSDLLVQMRVERAKELILQTDLNFTTVALECGFCDQSHLNKHFRKSTGLAPGEYRRKYAG